MRTNDIAAMRRLYGVEACRSSIIEQITAVFGVYGIEVDERHLGLIADYMTFEVCACLPVCVVHACVRAGRPSQCVCVCVCMCVCTFCVVGLLPINPPSLLVSLLHRYTSRHMFPLFSTNRSLAFLHCRHTRRLRVTDHCKCLPGWFPRPEPHRPWQPRFAHDADVVRDDIQVFGRLHAARYPRHDGVAVVAHCHGPPHRLRDWLLRRDAAVEHQPYIYMY